MAQTSFTSKLLKWHAANKRDLPWKKTRDPYKIWLSEIILQQTRVEQGTPYYHRMVRLFPTIRKLAAASEDEVMKAWQGLGYYSRARNLHAAAKQIVSDRKGKFPSGYEDILQLKGVGEYTAAAIASFAFDLPHAVVDGNVFRVLSRAFGLKEDISASSSKKKFTVLANQILDKKNPAAFNQAIMDFGALVCTPANPQCSSCFFKKSCYAFRHKMVDELPLNKKKQTIKTRCFNFLVFDLGNHTIINKRNDNDIWKGLYQFPMMETSELMNAEEIVTALHLKKIANRKSLKVNGISEVVKHKLSHQTIIAQFVRMEIEVSSLNLASGWQMVRKQKLSALGFPKIISEYLKKYLH